MFAVAYRSIGHATGTADRLYQVAGDLDASYRRVRCVRVFLRRSLIGRIAIRAASSWCGVVRQQGPGPRTVRSDVPTR